MQSSYANMGSEPDHLMPKSYLYPLPVVPVILAPSLSTSPANLRPSEAPSPTMQFGCKKREYHLYPIRAPSTSSVNPMLILFLHRQYQQIEAIQPYHYPTSLPNPSQATPHYSQRALDKQSVAALAAPSEESNSAVA